MQKSKIFSYILIGGGLIVLIVIAVMNRSNYSAPALPPPPPPAAEVQSPSQSMLMRINNAEYSFSYEYLQSVFAKTEAQYRLPFFSVDRQAASDVLTHTAALPYCSPKGDCERTTTDIKITIAPTDIKPADLQAAIEFSYGQMEEVRLGQNVFKTKTAGVEGEGEVYYLIPLADQNKSLLIIRRFIDENILIGYKDKPEFIPFSEQKRLTENLLASLILEKAPEQFLSYELVHNLTGEYATHEYHDAKLVQKSNGSVLVPSIKQEIPALRASFNTSLEKLSFPANSKYLYFTVIISETDAPMGDVYRFDLESKKFTMLVNVSKYRGFGAQELSPNGLFIASTYDYDANGQVRKLYLLDLERDTVKTLITLPISETLNYCVNDCLGSNYGVVSWKDDTTIEYAVYDSQKVVKDQNGIDVRPLKAKRTITIK